MKYISKVLFFIVLLFLSCNLKAQDYDEEYESYPLDQIFEFQGHKFYVKVIEHTLFNSLYKEHHPQQLISRPTTDIQKVEKLLGDDIMIDFSVFDRDGQDGYSFSYIEKKNQYRVHSSIEGFVFVGYYPKERIITYDYGDLWTDGAMCVDTGEDASYFPQYATLSADSIHFMQGVNDGIETTDYTYYKLDSKTNKYVKQFSLNKAFSEAQIFQIWNIHKSFWIDNTFYFSIQTGYSEDEDDMSVYSMCSVTML